MQKSQRTRNVRWLFVCSVLRSQTVGAAEQELGVLDGLAAEQHGQTVDAQTEAAVRGAAVLEELQIELDVIGQAIKDAEFLFRGPNRLTP